MQLDEAQCCQAVRGLLQDALDCPGPCLSKIVRILQGHEAQRCLSHQLEEQPADEQSLPLSIEAATSGAASRRPPRVLSSFGGPTPGTTDTARTTPGHHSSSRPAIAAPQSKQSTPEPTAGQAPEPPSESPSEPSQGPASAGSTACESTETHANAEVVRSKATDEQSCTYQTPTSESAGSCGGAGNGRGGRGRGGRGRGGRRRGRRGGGGRGRGGRGRGGKGTDAPSASPLVGESSTVLPENTETSQSEIEYQPVELATALQDLTLLKDNNGDPSALLTVYNSDLSREAYGVQLFVLLWGYHSDRILQRFYHLAFYKLDESLTLPQRKELQERVAQLTNKPVDVVKESWNAWKFTGMSFHLIVKAFEDDYTVILRLPVLDKAPMFYKNLASREKWKLLKLISDLKCCKVQDGLEGYKEDMKAIVDNFHIMVRQRFIQPTFVSGAGSSLLDTGDVPSSDGAAESLPSGARTRELVPFEPPPASSHLHRIAVTQTRRRSLPESGGPPKRARRESPSSFGATIPATPSAIGRDEPGTSKVAIRAPPVSSAITDHIANMDGAVAPRRSAGHIGRSAQGAPTNAPSGPEAAGGVPGMAPTPQTSAALSGATRTPNMAPGLGAPSRSDTEHQTPARTPIPPVSPTSPSSKILEVTSNCARRGASGNFEFHPPGPCHTPDFTPHDSDGEEDESGGTGISPRELGPGWPSGYDKYFVSVSTIPSLAQLMEAGRTLDPSETSCHPLRLTKIIKAGKEVQSHELDSALAEVRGNFLDWPPSLTAPFDACWSELKPSVIALHGRERDCPGALYYLECGTIKCPEGARGFIFIPVTTFETPPDSELAKKIYIKKLGKRKAKSIGFVGWPKVMIMDKIEDIMLDYYTENECLYRNCYVAARQALLNP
ncbi:hypothetical protein Micbo1qcDRAFT_225556 [Microdochium bolleyi]|uniref:Uncharacterized protein n=1 Tax=Microdochium bolleyi TaxID=196109 RepID=A0A136IJK8_9PEZI|nr:hypothetical protein Micbo1qcDRAFT_225556 [Microdochium bolleyi]